MGCDIHGLWEVKDHTGNWMAISTISGQRDYVWFGIIADVREGPDLGTAHRGVPPDPSAAWQDMIKTWGEDLHSHTWLSPAEVQKANREYAKRSLEHHDDYQVPPGQSYEYVPTAQSPVEQLIVGWNKNVYDAEVICPWLGTVKDLMIPSGGIKDCLRMVVAFDS